MRATALGRAAVSRAAVGADQFGVVRAGPAQQPRTQPPVDESTEESSIFSHKVEQKQAGTGFAPPTPKSPNGIRIQTALTGMTLVE